MKKVLAILLVLALAASMCFVMAGCGDDKKSDDKDKKDATQAATTTAPTAPAATKAGGNSQSGTSTQAAPGTYSQASGYTANDVWYAGISENDALSKALNAIPEGGTLTAIYPGYYNDGSPCWMVSVIDGYGNYYLVYVSSDYCYTIAFGDYDHDGEDDLDDDDTDDDDYDDDVYGGLTREAAMANAAAAVGEGANCYGAYQTVLNDGSPAWSATVEAADGSWVTVVLDGNGVIAMS